MNNGHNLDPKGIDPECSESWLGVMDTDGVTSIQIADSGENLGKISKVQLQTVKARGAITTNNPRGMGLQNELVIMELIARFGYSTENIARLFIRDQNGRVAKRLLKSGVLKKIRLKNEAYTTQFGSVHHVLVLSDVGLRKLQTISRNNYFYPEENIAAIKQSHVSHTLERQIAHKFVMMLGHVNRCLTPRDPGADIKTAKSFDDLALDRQGNIYLLETELTAKSKNDFCDTRHRVIKSLQQKNSTGGYVFKEVWYFIDPSIQKLYEDGFRAGAEIFHWHPQTKNIYKKGPILLKIPPEIASRIKFFPIKKRDFKNV